MAAHTVVPVLNIKEPPELRASPVLSELPADDPENQCQKIEIIFC